MIKLRSQIMGKNRRLLSCGCHGSGHKSRPWTAEEIEYLRREYPSRGWWVCRDLDRTKVAVRHKATALGLENHYKRPYHNGWSKEEDDVIRRLYATGGSTVCLAQIPKRSKSQIRHRAYLMGIKCPNNKRIGVWSAREKKIIKELYPTGGWEAVNAVLPHRTRDSIQGQARELHVLLLPSWSAEDERDLARLYKSGGIVACRPRFPDHSEQSIRAKARGLGIFVDVVPAWTDEDVRILREVFPRRGVKGCLELLPHKSEPAIYSKCTKLKIRFTGWWTPQEEQILKMYYPVAGVEVAWLINHSLPAIRHKAKMLGLRSPIRWTPEQEDIIRQYYGALGTVGCKPHLPTHTLNSIRSKAQNLGISFKGKGSKGSLSEPEEERLAA